MLKYIDRENRRFLNDIIYLFIFKLYIIYVVGFKAYFMLLLRKSFF